MQWGPGRPGDPGTGPDSDEPVNAAAAARVGRQPARGDERFYKREFWQTENLKFVAPHFRLVKVARIVRQLASGRRCDLLDVGCGPATLSRLMPGSVRYHGIDIAVQEPAANLIEMDFVDEPISFRGQSFDLIVVQGVFEYVGRFQSRKLKEIRDLLRDGGTFVVTYTNYAHRRRPATGHTTTFSSLRSSGETWSSSSGSRSAFLRRTTGNSSSGPQADASAAGAPERDDPRHQHALRRGLHLHLLAANGDCTPGRLAADQTAGIEPFTPSR